MGRPQREPKRKSGSNEMEQKIPAKQRRSRSRSRSVSKEIVNNATPKKNDNKGTKGIKTRQTMVNERNAGTKESVIDAESSNNNAQQVEFELEQNNSMSLEGSNGIPDANNKALKGNNSNTEKGVKLSKLKKGRKDKEHIEPSTSSCAKKESSKYKGKKVNKPKGVTHDDITISVSRKEDREFSRDFSDGGEYEESSESSEDESRSESEETDSEYDSDNEHVVSFPQRMERTSSHKADDVANMVEKLVDSKMKAERENLREEYKKLEDLKRKYERLEKEHSKGNKSIIEGSPIKLPNNKRRYDSIQNTPPQPMVKSPSDTTIYVPALNRARVCNEKDVMIDKIVNFVEEIRSQQRDKESRHATPSRESQAATEDNDDRDEARTLASKLILEAEQYKATVEQPQGKQPLNEYDHSEGPSSSVNDRNELSDNDFFHLICHVDANMRNKIKNGQYVDLEKLLPHDKLKKQDDNGTRLGWWQKGVDTFLAPVDKERKITNVRRWDQAFRIYSTIYCKVNPERTGEIWQYIDIIHTAASAFVWDNVANYDYIFRQLMEFNPKRSWALTYNQMWNLSMVEPLQRFGGKQFNSKDNFQQKRKSLDNGNRPVYDHCWAFQKNSYCKFGSECRYDNICSYCDSPKHGKGNCPKLDVKSEPEDRRYGDMGIKSQRNGQVEQMAETENNINFDFDP